MDDDGGSFILLLLASLLISGPIGAAIGNRKGAGVSGYFVGALLGPLGWIIMLVSKGNRIPCPSCRESIDPGATLCPKCHSKLSFGQLVPQAQPVAERYSANAYPDLPVPTIVPTARAIPAPPKRAASIPAKGLRVSKDGEDLGNVELENVRGWLQTGELTFADHYFDGDMGEWLTLDCHPQLADLQA